MNQRSSATKLSFSRVNRRLALNLLLVMLLFVMVSSVFALTLPLRVDQVSGVWDTSSATAATPGGYPNVISGSTWNDISCSRIGTIGGEAQIGWGSNRESCPEGLSDAQSRFGFTGTSNLATNPDEFMLLGRFTHYNNSIIAEKILGYINLNITLDFNAATAASPDQVTIPVRLQLDETPNNQEVCPYGGECSDAVYVSLPNNPIPVTIDGLSFSMLDVGFVPASSNTCPAAPDQSPESQFISEEGGSRSACVYAAIRFTGSSGFSINAQPETQTIPPNTSANLTFTVANTSESPLQNVVVTSPLCTPAYVSGDSNNDGWLDPTESWIYSCATAPLTANTSLSVTANADDLNGAALEPASDTAVINVQSATAVPTDSPTDVPATQVPTDVPPTQEATPSLTATPAASPTNTPLIGTFDPGLSKIGYLPEGSLGLPGEAINWDITISNYGGAAGTDVVVVDELRSELRIDGVTLEKGSYTISGQTVTITIPRLEPGEDVLVTIATTVLSTPDNRTFTNTATMPGTDETVTASLRVRAPMQVQPSDLPIVLAASTPDPINGPIPQVSGAPTVDVFPGDQVCWEENFSNGGTRPGFGPYMILILEPELTLDSIAFYGYPLTPVFVGTFPPSGQLTDPIADEVINGPVGNTMVVVRLPIGSVVTGGPALPVEFCVTVAPDATIEVPLPIEVIGGYEFGDTATGDNGAILNTPDPDNGSITPRLVIFDKSNNTPESERPPGPIWEYSYFLDIELAPDKTLTNAAFNDTLSPYFQYTQLILPPTGTCNATQDVANTSEPSTSTPGGTLIVAFTQIVNPSLTSTCTLRVEYRGYITDILSETGGLDTTDITNTATFSYNYLGNPRPPLNDTDVVSAENIVFQKSASPATVSPGTTVNYAVAFQITEYDSVAALTITDTMSAGLDYTTSSGTITIPGFPVTPITPTITTNPDGTLTLFFDLTAALSGQTIPAGVAGTLNYQGVVREIYRNSSPPVTVSAADPLPNSVVGNFTLTSGAQFQNTSGATVVVEPISINKEVISTPRNGIGYEPGEPVTYRVTVQIPSGDTQDVIFRDYFPLPVFDIDHPDLGIQVGSAPFTLPRTNVTGTCAGICGIALGPAHTLGSTADNISIDTSLNALIIDWPDINATTPQTLQFDLTIAITNDPFADGLYLSNISTIATSNTPGQELSDGDIVHIRVRAPRIDITKGVAASTNAAANGTINPPPSTLPVDGNISQSDAGDVITYVITVENTGGAAAYNVRVEDPPVAGLTGCTIMSVTNGAGTPLAYTGNLFDTLNPLVLTNPLPGNPAGDPPGSAAANAATALITVNCTLDSTTSPGQAAIINTATARYRSLDINNSPDFPSVSDTASVAFSQPTVTKTVTPTTATIGEVVTYTLTTTLPDGVLNNASIADTLPAGMAFVDCISISASAGVSTSLAGGISSACNDPTNPVVANPGQLATWSLGNITTTPSTAAGAHTITIRYSAVVLNQAAVVRGTTLTNSAVFNWTDTLGATHSLTPAQATVTVVEPTLQVVKTAAPTGTIDAGDILTYTLVISHTAASNATAYEAVLADNIPANTTYVAGSLAHIGGVAPDSGTLQYDGIGNRVVANWASLAVGQTSTIRFQVQVNNNVQPALVITNTANTQWTSQPGSPTNTTYNPLGVERTGNPADPGGAANTYSDDGSVSRTVGSPTVTKVVFSTSLAETGNGSDSEPDLTIGEQVTYRVTITFREGVTNGPAPTGAQIIDLLPVAPAALRYDSSQIISIGSNLSFSSSVSVGQVGTPSDRNGDSILDTTTWNLGTVTNTPDGTANNSDRIVVEITATVLNIAGNTGVTPPGQDLNVTNTGRLRYVNAAGAPINRDSTARVDIVEPRVIIDKTVTPTSADAGDSVTYTVTATNTGTTTAFNVRITDALLPNIPLDDGTVTATITGPGTHGTATITTGNNAGDTSVQVDLDVLRINQVLTITYQ
ncbi:MAG: Translocon-associated protein beta (TRAPB), partial [Chloroflexi bacterium OLB15]